MNSTRTQLSTDAGRALLLLVGAGPWFLATRYMSSGSGSGIAFTLLAFAPVLLLLGSVGLKLRSALVKREEPAERYPAIR